MQQHVGHARHGIETPAGLRPRAFPARAGRAGDCRLRSSSRARRRSRRRAGRSGPAARPAPRCPSTAARRDGCAAATRRRSAACGSRPPRAPAGGWWPPARRRRLPPIPACGPAGAAQHIVGVGLEAVAAARHEIRVVQALGQQRVRHAQHQGRVGIGSDGHPFGIQRLGRIAARRLTIIVRMPARAPAPASRAWDGRRRRRT